MAIARKRLKNHDAEEPASAIVEEAPTPQPAPPAPRTRVSLRALAAAALLVAGVVIVMLGWYGAAHTNVFTEQIPYVISGGLLGVALIILAGVLATGDAVLQETRRLREDVDRTLKALSEAGLGHQGTRGPPARVLVVPGGRTYHLPGCPIPEGKKVTTLSLDEALKTRFTPCKLCAE